MRRTYEDERAASVAIIKEVYDKGVSTSWTGEPSDQLRKDLREAGVVARSGLWRKAKPLNIPKASDMDYELTEKLMKANFKLGNKKLGVDTVIFNMTSGMDCPARDTCDVAKRCYAKADERFRPNCLNRRRRQMAFWDSVTPEQFVKAFPIPRYFRFSESGDFRSQKDVDKMAVVAGILKERHGVVTYGYTNRPDLDMSGLMKHAVVNGHGFMLSNNTVVEDAPTGPFVCPGNCRTCDYCKVARGVVVRFKLRKR